MGKKVLVAYCKYGFEFELRFDVIFLLGQLVSIFPTCVHVGYLLNKF